MMIHLELKFQPVTPSRWKDLEDLFGARGACGGCWCMTWRLERAVFEKQKGAANKRTLKKIVDKGPPPGVLAYYKGHAIGWCAVAPRSEYPALERSRVLKPIDDQPVWSISCIFVRKEFRRKNISTELIKAAVNLAKKHGAKIVEGYPQEPKNDLPDPFVWTGLTPAYIKAGFVEAHRFSPVRPIMRCVL
ncbi:GNAT family N-acetyltransferase [bacterium]|nr:GNAT family N-acetyltransferase [bacterium]